MNDRIAFWVAQGYQVTSQTPTGVQLVRPKRFNPVELIAMPLYLIEYLGQSARTVYIAVADDGTITESGSGVQKSAYLRSKDRSLGSRLLIVAGLLAAITLVMLLIRSVS